MSDRDTYDVAVLGGGLAGLTFAIQLKRQRPETSIIVLDKREGAAPEAAFKVGESTVPGGAHYFAEVVGMKEHLDEFHIRKCGLRYFLSLGDNSEIAKRVEIGPNTYPPHDNYQIDRGRFENELTARANAAGADVRQGCWVSEITFGPDMHTVAFKEMGEDRIVDARWAVDASGRAGLIKRKLGLGKEVGHTVNASWFRITSRIDLEQWGADDAAWLGRMLEVGLRQYSTNHLLGEGYWVWLIPLGSGSHSVGVCTDPRIHPYGEVNTLEGIFDWIDRHEPQLGATVRPRLDEVQDFLTLEDFAYGAERIYSPDRWALVGEAGVFADPFYSPGSDLIGYSNIFSCNLVAHDLDGHDVAERVEFYNAFHLHAFGSTLARTEDMYPVFGNPVVMLPKLGWDAVLNHYGTTLVLIQNRLGDFEFLKSVQPEIDRIYALNIRMQQLFRDWHQLEHPEWTEILGQIPPPNALLEALVAVVQHYSDDELRAKLKREVQVAEGMAVGIFHKAAGALPTPPDGDRPVNPYAVSLRPEQWEAEGLYTGDGLTREAAEQIAGGLMPLFADTVKDAPPPMLPGGPPGGRPGGPPGGRPGGPPVGAAGGPPAGRPGGQE